MTTVTKTLFLGIGAVLLSAPLSLAVVVPQQKPAGACDAVWDLGDASGTPGAGKAPYVLDCQDGDSSCDQDGAQNNSCTIEVAACIGTTAVSGCTANALTAPVKVKKLGKISGLVPPSGTSGADCGTPGRLTLALRKGGRKPSKPFVLTLTSKSSAGKGLNRVKVRCVANTGGGGGGASQCEAKPAGVPRELIFTVPATGSDLDNGISGASHNFPIVNGSQLHQCLSNCDGTTDSLCDMNGPIGEGTSNGVTFGAPLPLLASNVNVCVVNRFREPLSGTVDLATGEVLNGNVPLFSDVYVRLSDTANICPRCTNGRCTGNSKRDGQPCTVNGRVTVVGSGGDTNYDLSSDCQPAGQPAGSLNILLPLTTESSSKTGPTPCAGEVGQRADDQCVGGAACVAACSASPPAKGGIHQTCCANDPNKPCFPTRGGGTMTRQGARSVPQPAWPDPTYPKTTPAGQAALLAGTFCIGVTGDTTVDGTTGLPGPGAILLPADLELIAGGQ